MDTWIWIVIAVVALLVLVALFARMRGGGDRKLEKQREEARELRREAQQRMGAAGQKEAAAEQEAELARRQREAAEDAMRRANEVDPDVPDVDNAHRGERTSDPDTVREYDTDRTGAHAADDVDEVDEVERRRDRDL